MVTWRLLELFVLRPTNGSASLGSIKTGNGRIQLTMWNSCEDDRDHLTEVDGHVGICLPAQDQATSTGSQSEQPTNDLGLTSISDFGAELETRGCPSPGAAAGESIDEKNG